MAVELGPDALRDFNIGEVITVGGVRYFRVRSLRRHGNSSHPTIFLGTDLIMDTMSRA